MNEDNQLSAARYVRYGRPVLLKSFLVPAGRVESSGNIYSESRARNGMLMISSENGRSTRGNWYSFLFSVSVSDTVWRVTASAYEGAVSVANISLPIIKNDAIDVSYTGGGIVVEEFAVNVWFFPLEDVSAG